ncbi:MAG: hypothetical protein GZ091_01745 [Paludibacter sp.]|nr:hypothetical protein [Paludibacter sp.]
MKNLTLLFAACSMAFMSYAAGGNITYELNGGVTNSHGWQNKNDMYMGLNAAWNTFKPATTTWTALDVLIAANGAVNAVPLGIPTQAATIDKPFIEDPAVKAEWQWLVDYMVAADVAQGKALASAGGATLRYNLSAFFFSSVRTGWPASPDYSVLGQPEAFIPAWKHAFAGPATYDGTTEVVIPNPYKEGFTFDGWYDNAGFTGTKITSIAVGAEGNKALYAKWVEYIPTCKEVVALGAGKATKAGGIVTFIDGTTVYLQDASGGLKVEFTAAPDVVVGNKITLSGTTAALSTYIKITGATSLSKETATLPAIQTVIIPTLTADPAAYMFEYVYLEGLTIKSYGSGSVVLTDDLHDITLMANLNQVQLPVNTKINLKAIVSYDTQVVLVGEASKVTAAPVPRPETTVYPSLEDGKYTLTNKWLVSNKMDNLSANPIGTNGYVRGMSAKDGKMYFIDRELKQLTVIDGANGKKLAPIKLASNIFMHTIRNQANTADSSYVAGTLPFNDIKQDAAGHILLGNGIVSNLQPFQVWIIDLATGNGTMIIDEILKDNPDFALATIRFDAFGVYGDVNGNAIIMTANASAMEAYKWTITNGVAGKAEQILIDTSLPGTFLTGLTTPGTAPQIFPLDENYFYLDGNATLPTLIDMSGTVVDGFYNVPKAVEDWSVGLGSKAGHNGLIEFELGGEYFFLMASTNTVGVPPSAFRLFKWANANKEFAAVKSLWTLPEAGMGAASNAYRTAVPSIEVNETTKTATLYLYTGENGYGVYEFKNNAANSLKTINNNAVTVFVNNRTLTLSKEVASVAVYSIAGQLVAKAKNVSSLNLHSNGVFVVKATTFDGETAIHKVIVK